MTLAAWAIPTARDRMSSGSSQKPKILLFLVPGNKALILESGTISETASQLGPVAVRSGRCFFLGTSSAPHFEAVGTPGGRGYVATWPTWGPPLILPPVLRRWVAPGGRGYVASWATCGPLVVLPPALKRWGPLRWQGLCSHLAHLCATSGFAQTANGWGPPKRQWLCSHHAQLWATFDFVPPPL